VHHYDLLSSNDVLIQWSVNNIHNGQELSTLYSRTRYIQTGPRGVYGYLALTSSRLTIRTIPGDPNSFLYILHPKIDLG
jgi:hypothetical protein